MIETLKGEAGAVVDQRRTVEGAFAVLTARVLAEQMDEVERMMVLADSDEKDRLLLRKRELGQELNRVDPRAGWRSVRRGLL